MTWDSDALRVVAQILSEACHWKNTRVDIDDAATDKYRLSSVLSCWLRKLDSNAREQRRHCLTGEYRGRRHPELFDHPCWMRDVDKTPPVRWTDFARPRTDYDAVIGAVEKRAESFEYRWCPGYDLSSVVVRIRRLPIKGEDYLLNEQAENIAFRVMLRNLGRAPWELAYEEDEVKRLATPSRLANFTREDAERLKELMPELEPEIDAVLKRFASSVELQVRSDPHVADDAFVGSVLTEATLSRTGSGHAEKRHAVGIVVWRVPKALPLVPRLLPLDRAATRTRRRLAHRSCGSPAPAGRRRRRAPRRPDRQQRDARGRTASSRGGGVVSPWYGTALSRRGLLQRVTVGRRGQLRDVDQVVRLEQLRDAGGGGGELHRGGDRATGRGAGGRVGPCER
jgi:hypothetical protein